MLTLTKTKSITYGRIKTIDGEMSEMRFIGIDPSTKTGLVVINEDGELVIQREITDKNKDPERMHNIIEQTINEVCDSNNFYETFVCIEDFAYSQGNRMALLGGIGWGIRVGLYVNGIEYIEVGTGQLKKFAGGKGNSAKDIIRLEVYKRWGFEHKSDNVIDAYVLAQVSRAKVGLFDVPKFQKEVLERVG